MPYFLVKTESFPVLNLFQLLQIIIIINRSGRNDTVWEPLIYQKYMIE